MRGTHKYERNPEFHDLCALPHFDNRYQVARETVVPFLFIVRITHESDVEQRDARQISSPPLSSNLLAGQQHSGVWHELPGGRSNGQRSSRSYSRHRGFASPDPGRQISIAQV